MKKEYLFLTLITFFGAFLRLINIGKESIWLDESFTVLYSAQSFSDIWKNFPTDVHPPLFYLIEHVFLLLGSSEWAIRIFPAMCGIVAIPVTYFAAREVLEENYSLLAATLLSVSVLAIHYSQEARMYSLVLLLITTALLFWLRHNNNKDNLSLVLFGICCGLALWTHVFCVIPVALMILMLPDMRSRMVGVATTLIVVSPLVVPMSTLLTTGLLNHVVGLTGPTIIIATWWAIGGFWEVSLYVSSLVFLIGVFVMWRNNKNVLALLTLLVVLGSMVLASIISNQVHIETRYFIYTLPFVFITIGYAMQDLIQNLKGSDLEKALLIVGVILIFAAPITSYYTQIQKDDWRSAYAETKDGRVVLVPQFNLLPYSFYSHNNETGISNIGDANNISLGEYDYLIVGPNGGYDPHLYELVNRTMIFHEVNGIKIYRMADFISQGQQNKKEKTTIYPTSN